MRDRFSKWLGILISDKCFSLVTFSTMICFGMFWAIPASLIYEIKANINEGMRVLGYLSMALRLGKMFGHLLAIKICGYFPSKRCSEIHFISMGVQFLGVVLTPHCTNGASLGTNWFIIGLTLGIIESNTVFFNSAVNKKSAHKYTNIYYFTFSCGCALTPIIVDATREKIHDPSKELFVVCWIVGGTCLTFNLFLVLVVALRRKHGTFVDQIEGEKLPDRQCLCVFSNVCLAITSFCFMCGRTILELFLLPYAMYSKAELSEKQSYSVVQCLFASQMIIRFIGIFIAIMLDKTSALLIFWNACLAVAVGAMIGFQDHTYLGIIVTMILFGFVLGSYQNTLLNWMSDRMFLDNKNTAPFFFGTTVGSTLTPAVIPHLIKNSDDSIDMHTYQILVEVLFTLSVVFCLALITTELLIRGRIAGRSVFNSTSSAVEVVNIVPERTDSQSNNLAVYSELTLNTATGIRDVGVESRATLYTPGLRFRSPLSPII